MLASRRPRTVDLLSMVSVLLVGDADSFALHAEHLAGAGIRPLTAASPEDAYVHLDIHPPDVVVTHWSFRNTAIASADFIRELRFRLDDATSIIVVSNGTEEDDRQKARAAGADAYLVGPALPDAVLFEVKRALILRRSGRRLPWNASNAAGSIPFPPRRRDANS